MDVEIRLRNTPRTERLRDYIRERLDFALSRFAPNLRFLKVWVSDLNGPRGGFDRCCRISAQVRPSGRLIWYEAVDTSLLAAIHRAAEGISQAVGREVGRVRNARRGRESVRRIEAAEAEIAEVASQ